MSVPKVVEEDIKKSLRDARLGTMALTIAEEVVEEMNGWGDFDELFETLDDEGVEHLHEIIRSKALVHLKKIAIQ